MKKFFKLFFLFTCFTLAGLFIWLKVTDAKIKDFPPLKDGDLVFQTINSSQTLGIMMASHSPYTHVGIVKKKVGGETVIVEAVGPVKETSLQAWVDQGIGGRITIKRFKGLDGVKARAILKAAENYYGRPYDFYFYLKDDQIYCSELVYYAFKDGANITIGKIELFQDLKLDNLAARSLIKKRWRNYPLCKSDQMTMGACVKLLKQQPIITPETVARDKNLQVIYSNYGVVQ